MPNYLFESFLQDDSTYEKCREFWNDLIDVTHAQFPGEEEWEPWGQETFADGSPMPRIDTPVLCRRSRLRDRGLTVQQGESKSGGDLIAAWVVDYTDALYEGVDVPSMALVISLVLTEVTVAQVRNLVTEWLRPELANDKIQSMLADINERGSAT